MRRCERLQLVVPPIHVAHRGSAACHRDWAKWTHWLIINELESRVTFTRENHPEASVSLIPSACIPKSSDCRLALSLRELQFFYHEHRVFPCEGRNQCHSGIESVLYPRDCSEERWWWRWSSQDHGQGQSLPILPSDTLLNWLDRALSLHFKWAIESALHSQLFGVTLPSSTVINVVNVIGNLNQH